ncbi:unnamed protein product [Bubo scandiacus]
MLVQGTGWRWCSYWEALGDAGAGHWGELLQLLGGAGWSWRRVLGALAPPLQQRPHRAGWAWLPSAGSYWLPRQPMSGGARGVRTGRSARARGGGSGAGRREASVVEPPHVAASWGCCGRLRLLLGTGGAPELRDRVRNEPRAMELALEWGKWPRAWGWPPAEDPGGRRRSLSFLSEDGTGGSVSSGLPGDGAGPLSSTRRSLLEEPPLGGGCGLGDPLLWLGCPPEPLSLSIPSLTPWPHAAPGGSALPPQPLASSTLLSAGDELGEGPQSQTAGGRTGGPPLGSPQAQRWGQPWPLSPAGVWSCSLGDSSGASECFVTALEPSEAGGQPRSPLGASSSPGSSPTVLLVPGDHGHPQDSPLDAQGSLGSSPTVLLVPGDHGHPQDSLSGAWGFPGAATSPNPRPGSPAVLLSPPSRSTHGTEEPLEDMERGQAPTERHSPGTEATASPEDTTVQDRRAVTVPPRHLSDEALRRRLRELGDNPGPVTELTRRFPELAAALRTGRVPDCAQDELALARQFDRPDRSRRWREGLVKSSFNYLLLDPRTTQNLPLRSHHLSPAECFRTFVKAIFYVGKGTRARPYCHLTEALSQHRAGTQKGCPKVRRILEIWASGQGVVSVHCFQSSVPAEAYTREGCLVEALGLQTLTNQRKGQCYGLAASWPAERRQRLGVHMLHRAMRIFLAEGERQLRPGDV